MQPDILNKFTTHLKNTLQHAAGLALELGNRYINPEHLLFGLAEAKGGIAFEILSRAGFHVARLKTSIRERNDSVSSSPLSISDLRFSLPAKRALEKAVLIANHYEHKYVGTEHLLWGILEINDATVEKFIAEHNVNPKETKQHLQLILRSTSKFPDISGFFDGNVRDGEGTSTTKERQKTAALDYFATDLTNVAQQKKIDPVIGREREIERLVHILARRTKNNPVLIGDPGVGKTAIVEGLAKKIVKGEVPDALLNKRILTLDLALVVAGTIYRGEFESRLKQIIDEMKSDPNTILFIDELHTIVGAGSASGSMDAANILKPALAKGHVRVIGATTLDEYKKHIEGDAALERRFQPIMVAEPTTEKTLTILKGIKVNYEKYHRVTITDEALEAAVELSERYIQDKFLPDKAIDLVDEAASKTKVESPGTSSMRKIRLLEEELNSLRQKKKNAVSREEFQAALGLQTQERLIETKLGKAREREAKFLPPNVGTIGKEDIAEVVARITGIPVYDLVRVERERLLHLEDQMKQAIIGQDEAIHAIADSIRRSRAGLSNPNRPIGSFIFIGPSGVGKTETAKELARRIFGDEKSLIRIDMSEFGESFNVSKLIGAPAGYVGYRESNKFSDAVKHRPYSVVLFDEIEKAHPDVFNILLQILDDGHLTDATGKRVNFKNTIIIMTSNIGLQNFNKVAAIGFDAETKAEEQKIAEQYNEVRARQLQELERGFRPEFLNRIDKVITFRPLMIRSVEKIVELQFNQIVERAKSQEVKLELSAAARKLIAQQGFSPDQGARAVRRVLQDTVESPLAERLLIGSVKTGSVVRVAVRNSKIILEKTSKKK
ncbi:MAG: ATP-dependent Clp protease ATP-binding subunit [Candidatus Kerfeldbacteria bacterium]|nr:ATP-dependent Clp protease ATP-binding subunit [Candidatus Kerfeldbacteria bacterium]